MMVIMNQSLASKQYNQWHLGTKYLIIIKPIEVNQGYEGPVLLTDIKYD